jgi:hypothetical protein
MGLEEDLLGALKFAKIGGKMPADKMVKQLVLNYQIGALKHLREQLDGMINELSKQGVSLKDMGMFDPFKILGVSADATQEEVRKAYKAAARKAHPDAGGSNEEMMKINAAYEAICRFRGWSK